ncbi:TenA family protein [Marinifilum sp. RC60d5]|uniref:TenA family protein n=1 Tax=Marinifilum sp. RC60d5 TaxID=3458414 RepID=UPI0040355535
MKAAGPFTQEIWEFANPICKQITSCPFVSELAAGTLSQACFAHYLTQDVLYLKKDAEALGNLCHLAITNEDKSFFKKLQTDGLEIEQIVREEYLSYYKLKEVNNQSPAFADYSDFLLKHSQESTYEVACAALLPCFWIYAAVGSSISEQNVDHNPYQKFIDTYVGEEYEFYTNQFIEIVERNSVFSGNKNKMIEAFVLATQHELNVFQESMLFNNQES